MVCSSTMRRESPVHEDKRIDLFQHADRDV